MKFDNKIIVSDIDGTFFDDSSRIPDTNIDAINYFKENGGIFTFATGRNEITMEPEIAKLANAPLIFCNGSYIYDYDTLRRHNEICIAPGPALSIIKTVIESFTSVTVTITAGSKLYILGNPENLSTPKVNVDENDYAFVTLDEVPTSNWYSIVFHGEPSQLDLVEKFIKASSDGLYIICRSWPSMLEINNFRATKGNAALELRKLLEKGGDIQYKLYGIGDYGNDVELLKSADVSACPSNAIPELHEIADVVLCSNNDGAIAGLIEYIDANL